MDNMNIWYMLLENNTITIATHPVNDAFFGCGITCPINIGNLNDEEINAIYMAYPEGYILIDEFTMDDNTFILQPIFEMLSIEELWVLGDIVTGTLRNWERRAVLFARHKVECRNRNCEIEQWYDIHNDQYYGAYEILRYNVQDIMSSTGNTMKNRIRYSEHWNSLMRGTKDRILPCSLNN